ncbi:hypothetical protein [uncultured Roseovarius sp.]|uniref:hypothetical protein n=1 Tax=uncultured Roseovarius sp. TaxID=293344 RepID=UPI0026214FBE|nr:hypothetical protein [uncultured Roseovarius sp.]
MSGLAVLKGNLPTALLGEYQADEFLNLDAGRPIRVKIEGSPALGIAPSEDATLTVMAASEGKVSGSFVINVAHAEGDYSGYAGAPECLCRGAGTGSRMRTK